MVLAEIEAKADLPIILWGHCGGAAMTVELARVLEDQGFDLRHVFIGSKLLPPAHEMQDSIDMIDSWSDEQIIRYMVEETGYTELDGLDPTPTRRSWVRSSATTSAAATGTSSGTPRRRRRGGSRRRSPSSSRMTTPA